MNQIILILLAIILCVAFFVVCIGISKMLWNVNEYLNKTEQDYETKKHQRI